MKRELFRLSLAVFAVMFAIPASADDPPEKVDVSVVMLTELNIAEVTMDVEAVGGWIKPIIAGLETQFKDEAQKRVVVVQVSLYPRKPAEVEVAGDPALSEAETQALLKLADAAKAPHSKIASLSFQVVAQINGGGNKGGPTPIPGLKTPGEKRAIEFKAAGTAKRLELMRTWARTEALPVLSAITSRADPKFEGVVNLGKSIAGDDSDRPLDVAALTDRSPHYWRAMLEMVPDIPSVPAIRVVLHTANGELDQARRVAEIARMFDGKKSGPSRILGDFWAMHEVFATGVNTRIEEGIALHDKTKFAEALAIYDEVLKDYPKSAWVNYERYQTLLMMGEKEAQAVEKLTAEVWPKTREAILASDPLYPMLAVAQGQTEQNALRRRMKINELFKDKTKTRQDLRSYADIAMDLEVYGMAGMLYWDVVLSGKPNAVELENVIELLLYCQDKLGVKTLQESFNRDHKAEFAKIEAEQKKRMNRFGAEK